MFLNSHELSHMQKKIFNFDLNLAESEKLDRYEPV